MVPLLVQGLGVAVHLAIRFSTLAVLTSAAMASLTFLADGRAIWPIGLALGATAALGAQWSARRLNRVGEGQLVWMLRGLTVILAIDSGRRAFGLVSPGL
jgi:uncharacterized membrane protein YfcA